METKPKSIKIRTEWKKKRNMQKVFVKNEM